MNGKLLDGDAVELFKGAAELGEASAQGIYGIFLSEGRFVPQDTARGVQYARTSALAGDINGQELLARWFRKAADQGCKACAESLK